jgi:hypothetical protein
MAFPLAQVSGLRPRAVWALIVPCSPGLLFPSGRFLSGFSLTLHHCAFCTVIYGCVLCGHRAQLYGELLLGHVSGDGDVALEGWAVVSASTITYTPHPLQALLCRLTDPVPAVSTGCDGESRDSTGERQGLWGFDQTKSRFLQLHLGKDI